HALTAASERRGRGLSGGHSEPSVPSFSSFCAILLAIVSTVHRARPQVLSTAITDQKRGERAGRPLPPVPWTTRGFTGSKPSRCNFLRASLRARRTASAFSRTLFSEGFS